MSDVSNTIFVTVAILIGSFFSYLLQFFLGRTLSVADYGIFNTLLSVCAIVGVPAAVFGTALIKQVANLTAQKDDQKATALFWQSMIWSLALGIILFGFFYIFRDDVASVLKINSIGLVTAFAFYISLTFLGAVPVSYFQGLLKYKTYGIYIVVAAALRFTLPVLFILKDKSVLNVFSALSIGVLLVVIFGVASLKKFFVKVTSWSVKNEMLYMLKFSWPVLVTNVCMMTFSNNDLIMVRAYFSPETSGYYAGVVTLGKILLFGSATVSSVMFPRIAALKSRGENVKFVFSTFMKMQLAIVLIGALVFSIFPDLISQVFFGSKFAESVKYLPLFSLFVSLYVVLNFLVLFLFAVDITSLYNFLVLIAMSQILLIANFHASLFEVIFVNIGVIAVSLLIALTYTLNYLKKHKL